MRIVHEQPEHAAVEVPFWINELCYVHHDYVAKLLHKTCRHVVMSDDYLQTCFFPSPLLRDVHVQEQIFSSL
jgi:hypothetical protein